MPSLPRSQPLTRVHKLEQPPSQSSPPDVSHSLVETIRKRKAGVYAVALAVIAAAGAILGARLRSIEQDSERQAEAGRSPVGSKTQTSESSLQGQGSVSVEVVNMQGQVDRLEGRRGQLMLRKDGLERKIEELRQRMDKKKEREAEAERMRLGLVK